jgi:D-galacturonate reductase
MPVNALMVGAGEYTTGCVFTASGPASDKPAGVIALCFLALRRRGQIDKMVLADACGSKMPTVRSTMQEKIGNTYKNMDMAMTTLPGDDVDFNPEAYKDAIKLMNKGDVVTIFTPDDTHFPIAMACIEAGLHVLIAKPAVKTLQHHRALNEAAKKHGVLVAVEYHKRFDPIYTDAKHRIQGLGGFSFFTSTMTQCKTQLDTFRGWAGKSSDINYYLNSHHIDIHCWACLPFARPVKVTAMASTGVADERLQQPGANIEDTITLMVQWKNRADDTSGTAIYMASWAAPKADCHTQQYFHYMGQKGELRADQCHRGYNWSTDAGGFGALNPLYMKYTPDAKGFFVGQQGYGYQSIEKFVDACEDVNSGAYSPLDVTDHGVLATIDSTLVVTAILEAGRQSLDTGVAVDILYDDAGVEPVGLK